MKSKPSWRFFLTWLAIYTLLDILLAAILHSHFAWADLPGAIEGAALTSFFALFRWYKGQDRF
jgi:hypothetical protein